MVIGNSVGVAVSFGLSWVTFVGDKVGVVPFKVGAIVDSKDGAIVLLVLGDNVGDMVALVDSVGDTVIFVGGNVGDTVMLVGGNVGDTVILVGDMVGATVSFAFGATVSFPSGKVILGASDGGNVILDATEGVMVGVMVTFVWVVLSTVGAMVGESDIVALLSLHVNGQSDPERVQSELQEPLQVPSQSIQEHSATT